MEPLLINAFPMVYCYLPSFRGEDPDSYHLNQFYHCETELHGDMKKAIGVASALIVKIITNVVNRSAELSTIIERLTCLQGATSGNFPAITFDVVTT